MTVISGLSIEESIFFFRVLLGLDALLALFFFTSSAYGAAAHTLRHNG